MKGKLKCYRCAECNGVACKGELPGLGGVFEGKNARLNFEGWKLLREEAERRGLMDELRAVEFKSSDIKCGPVTGGNENVGYENEQDFYYPYLKTTLNSGFGLCIGDGCPDEKLEFGLKALKRLNEEGSSVKAAFFLKPYPQEILKKRIDLVKPYASHIGIDIDAYNIVTMRNKASLEKKTAEQLNELREYSGLPFVVKGVFTQDDLDLIRALRPEAAIVSNHGGRVETDIGSSAQFLYNHAAELKKYCGEVWVDGGIRTALDVQTAMFYGASKVIICRPLIRASFDEVEFKLK